MLHGPMYVEMCITYYCVSVYAHIRCCVCQYVMDDFSVYIPANDYMLNKSLLYKTERQTLQSKKHSLATF